MAILRNYIVKGVFDSVIYFDAYYLPYFRRVSPKVKRINFAKPIS